MEEKMDSASFFSHDNQALLIIVFGLVIAGLGIFIYDKFYKKED
jgi:hypothetical protein